MAKAKYPIKKEFFPYNLFTPPMSRWFVALAQKGMKVPGFLWKDPELEVQRHVIPAYQNGEIELFVLSPKGLEAPAPCLVNIHGGGFDTKFNAPTSQAMIAKRIAYMKKMFYGEN